MYYNTGFKGIWRRDVDFGAKVFCDLYWDHGKENGNYSTILGSYRDNGKEH